MTAVRGGSVTTMGMGWGAYPAIATSATFQVGSGVSFLYAASPSGIADAQTGIRALISKINSITDGPLTFLPDENIETFLGQLNALFTVNNPFHVNAQQDSILGLSFTDPVSWVEGFGLNLVEDLVALLLRAFLLFFGLAILLKVVNNFIDLEALGNRF